MSEWIRKSDRMDEPTAHKLGLDLGLNPQDVGLAGIGIKRIWGPRITPTIFRTKDAWIINPLISPHHDGGYVFQRDEQKDDPL